jgi:hypothetical protein
MSSRYRKPETVLLNISRGDWLLVKKHLTAGEQRQIFRRMLTANGGTAIEPVNVGLSKMIGYLLDWSITDADDQPVVIRDQDDDAKAAALDGLPPEDFKEILTAIEAHEDAMEALREQEKNDRDGAKASSPISPSPRPSGGDTSGSRISTEMSIA